jgi:hypothetical protein
MWKSMVHPDRPVGNETLRIGALQHHSLKVYCALTPKEFLHSSIEALHTERYTAPQLAKEGPM